MKGYENMLSYAIIGFGGLGKKHFRNTKELCERVGDVKLTAICDIEESAFNTQTDTNISTEATNLDLSAYRLYTDVNELFENEKLDFVIAALPTSIHEKIAVMAMERKIHVFSEKPMALNEKECENMLKASRENNVRLMIGQCVRYSSAVAFAKELVESGKYGRVLYANFERFSGPPVWTWKKWMLDEEKSGGAALDLHIHDVDLICYLFGEPKSISARRVSGEIKNDGLFTTYDFDDGMFATARGSWGFNNTYRFRSGFLIKFENATFESGGGKAILYTDDSKEEVKLPPTNVTLEELVDFVCCIRNGENSKINPPEASALSVKIALLEKEKAKLI